MVKIKLRFGRMAVEDKCLMRYLELWKGSTTEANELALIRLCSRFGLYLPDFCDWLREFERCPAREELVEALGRLRANAFGTPTHDEEKISFIVYGIALRWNALVNRAATQAGKKLDKARHMPKKPDVNKWIRKQLDAGTDETIKELYARAPDYVTDAVGLGRFEKRVAKERKKKNRR